MSEDWNNYFACAENLKYRIQSEYGITYLLTDNSKTDLREISNFWNNAGIALDAPEWQKARYRYGYWLEFAVQVALRKAKIAFEGNSMNINHFPHSKGLHVDMNAKNLLIECTNLRKWLGFEGMQEKINYFFKADPHHKKVWILVTTWQKCIPKLIRQQILNNNITVLYTNRTANSKNHNNIAEQLVQPLLNLNQQATTINSNLINNPLLNNHKNRYQNLVSNSLRPDRGMCGINNLKNESGLDG